MSALTRVFSRRTRCLESNEPDVKDPELGHIQTAHDAATPPRVGDPHRLACEVEPANGARHENQNSPHGFFATSWHPSPRSSSFHGELSSSALTINTRTAHMNVGTLYADSEFSRYEVPVSPDRYDFALNAIERDSPTTPTHAHLVESDKLEASRQDEVTEKNPLYSKVDRVPTVPRIEDDDLEGDIDSVSGSSSDRSITRYSGFFVNNNGYRQMSEGEIEAELQASMHSLRIVTTREQRKLISGHGTDDSHPSSSSRAYKSLAEKQRLPNRTLSQIAMHLDPGSSQTSSSREGMTNSDKVSSSLSQHRSPTPPLLYGRNTRSSSNVREIENNGQTRIFGSIAEDWETVSDMRSNFQVLNETADTHTGSSLADNSDPGDISVLEPTFTGPRRLGPSQHPGLPRPHQAFIMMKDLRSGSTTNIPLHELQEDRRYQHPIPISENHVNPFLSSPPAFQSKTGLAVLNDLGATAAQNSQRQSSMRSNSTDFDKLVETYGSINDARNGHDMDEVGREAIGQNKQGSMLKEPSPDSSTWLSTVSESVAGEESPHPTRNGSFAMVTILNSKGNLTGTPEGTGAREVGSSLAGASSPPDQSLSSPVANLDPIQPSSAAVKSPWTPRGSESSPSTAPEDPSSVVYGAHTPTPLPRFAPLTICGVSKSPTTNVQTPTHQKTPDEAVAMCGTSSMYSFTSADSNAQSSLTSRARAFFVESPSRQRRRRSSPESDSKATAPSSSTKATALPSFDARRHRKRNAMAGLLTQHSSSDDAMTEKYTHQGRMRERQVDQADIGSNQISTSTASGSSGSVLRLPAIPPAVYSPVVPSGHPQQDCGSLQARMDKIRHAMTRQNSPHLVHVPCIPTVELVERQKQISKLWLPIFCIIPPCALIFGYGYADGVIRYQSEGEIHRFTERSMMVAKVWGLLATPITIAVIVICMSV